MIFFSFVFKQNVDKLFFFLRRHSHIRYTNRLSWFVCVFVNSQIICLQRDLFFVYSFVLYSFGECEFVKNKYEKYGNERIMSTS